MTAPTPESPSAVYRRCAAAVERAIKAIQANPSLYRNRAARNKLVVHRKEHRGQAKMKAAEAAAKAAEVKAKTAEAAAKAVECAECADDDGEPPEPKGASTARGICWDWNRGRPCTDHCKKHNFLHICQACRAPCAFGEGQWTCSACEPTDHATDSAAAASTVAASAVKGGRKKESNYVDVPNGPFVNFLVGKGGHAVRALETATGAVIDVVSSKGPAVPRRIRIEGNAAAVVKAKGAIADRLDTTIEALAKTNGLKRPYRLQPGQVLKNPRAPNAQPARASRPSPGGAEGGTYTVQRGDTLFGIAQKTGVTVEALRSANGLRGNAIAAGQKLKLPGGAASEAAPSRDDDAALADRMAEAAQPRARQRRRAHLEAGLAARGRPHLDALERDDAKRCGVLW